MSVLGKTEFRIRWTPVLVEYWPSTHFVAGRSWSVCLKYQRNELTGHVPYLSVYLYCNKDMNLSNDWSCKARTQFSIIPRSKHDTQVMKMDERVYDAKNNVLALNMFCDWNTVITSCKKGKIIFETKIEVLSDGRPNFSNPPPPLPQNLTTVQSNSSPSTSEEESHENGVQNGMTTGLERWTNPLGQIRFPSGSSDKENETHFPNKSELDILQAKVVQLEQENKRYTNEIELSKKLKSGVIHDLEVKIQNLEEKNLTLVVENQDLKTKFTILDARLREKELENAKLRSRTSVFGTCNIKSASIKLMVTPQRRQTVAERLFMVHIM